MNRLNFTEALNYKEAGTLIRVTKSSDLGDTIVLSIIQDEGMALLALSAMGEVLAGMELSTGAELEEEINDYLSSGWTIDDNYHEKMQEYLSLHHFGAQQKLPH